MGFLSINEDYEINEKGIIRRKDTLRPLYNNFRNQELHYKLYNENILLNK